MESQTLTLYPLREASFHHLASFLLFSRHACMQTLFLNKEMECKLTRDIISCKIHMHANLTSYHRHEIIASHIISPHSQSMKEPHECPHVLHAVHFHTTNQDAFMSQSNRHATGLHIISECPYVLQALYFHTTSKDASSATSRAQLYACMHVMSATNAGLKI